MSATPFSLLMNKKKTIPGILISLPTSEFDYFNIGNSTPPLKFRMMDYLKQIFVFEVYMEYTQNPDKILKLHLDPQRKAVKNILKLSAKTKTISFHFYNTDKGVITPTIIKLNPEESGWFKRNHELSSKFLPNNDGYKKFTNQIKKIAGHSERICNYNSKTDNDFFVRKGSPNVKYMDTIIPDISIIPSTKIQ